MIISYKTFDVIEKVSHSATAVFLVSLLTTVTIGLSCNVPRFMVTGFIITVFSSIVAFVTNNIYTDSEQVPDEVHYLMKQGYTKEEATDAWYESEIFFDSLKGDGK